MESTKKNLDPETNILQISMKKNMKFFIFLSKIFFNKFEEIELHGLGEAISNTVIITESLVRYGYCSVEKVSSFTHILDQETNSEDSVKRKKIKMVVKLKRDKDFFKKVEGINN